ncbi:MAG: ABC transporter ATP-binding protein [Sulfurospirillaceae bacterium]|nr:ABC transporter ATP-binding protein [Sulfurospirillaceae bacterium]MDD3462104.1 ABC transporter ATP-binding protein [Sulfurospirillaceae bacterium]
MTLSIKNLNYALGKKRLLQDISFESQGGQIVGIIGPNGAGKSTLLKHIAGFLKPNTSNILLDKIDLCNLNPRALSKKVAYLSQFSSSVHISVLETLELGRRTHSGMQINQKDKQKIEETITHFDLKDLLERDLDSLSGGERQKVLIASALLQEPDVLLLDEPISHLDPKNQLEMLQAVKKITIEKGLVTLIVLHDIQHAIHYSTMLLLLKKGKISNYIETGQLNKEMLEELFDVKTSLHVSEGHTFVYYGHVHDEGHRLHHHHTF